MPLLLTPLLAVVVTNLWVTGARPALTARWSAVALVYFLFFSPSDCVEFGSDQLRCRSASSGLLRSCPQLSCKRKNRLRFARLTDGGGWWRARGSEVLSTPRNMLTSLGPATSVTLTLFALVFSVIPR